jgi:hypothetical protein
VKNCRPKKMGQGRSAPGRSQEPQQREQHFRGPQCGHVARQVFIFHFFLFWERMEAVSCTASPSAPLDSSPSGYCLRPSKRQRVSLGGSPSTSTGSIVKAISSGVPNPGILQWPQHRRTQDLATRHPACQCDAPVCVLPHQRGC